MTYERRIVHYSPGPTDLQAVISNRAVAGCTFELNRLGGCGAGELRLKDEFSDRSDISVGDWIAFDYSVGNRWYFGRVEHRSAVIPGGVTFRLEGMGVQLAEVFPGGFGPAVGDGVPPHRYAQTDLFPNDPDYSEETLDIISEPRELVILMMQQYVVPRTDIQLDLAFVDPLSHASSVTSLKYRGEESVRSIFKELAMRSRHASFGVRADGKFYFHQRPELPMTTYRIGRDIISLEETQERNQLYNRVVLTGGYIYNENLNSDVTSRGFYRWRGNYVQMASRAQYGERRIRLKVPWIRTPSDSLEFIREFFRVYAQPTIRYRVEVGNVTSLPVPWLEQVRLENSDGTEIVTSPVETLRVQFDHAPKIELELGPEDPQTHWPEPAYDERWEIPGEEADQHGGDTVTLTIDVEPSLSDEISTLFSSLESSESDDSSDDVTSDDESSLGEGSSEESSSGDETDESESSDSESSEGSDSMNSESSDDSSESSSDFGSSQSCNLIYDSFTESVTKLLTVHTPDSSPPGFPASWSLGDTGNFRIFYNDNRAISESSNVVAYIDPKISDYVLSCEVSLLSSGSVDKAGVAVRPTASYNSVSGRYAFRLNYDNQTFELYDYYSSVLRDSASLTVDYDETYLIEVVCDGESMTGTVDGGHSVSYSSSVGKTITLCGLDSGNGNDGFKLAAFEDFCVSGDESLLPELPP